MNLSSELIHDLAGLAARISSIVSLVSNPEARKELDLARMDADMRKALRDLEDKWDQAMPRGAQY